MEKCICQLCGEETELVKAHIIPKCLLTQSVDKEEKLLILKEGEKCFNKKYPKGIWDNKILCKTCDGGTLSNLDKKGLDFLSKDISGFYLNVETGCYEIPDTEYDYYELKRFFISILWKASISKNNLYCKDIDLGKKYNNLCKDFLNRNIKDVEEIDVILIKLTHNDEKFLKEFCIMLNNYRKKGEYSFICSGYRIFYKVSNRPLDPDLLDYKLSKSKWIIPKDEVTEQNEYKRSCIAAKMQEMQ